MTYAILLGIIFKDDTANNYCVWTEKWIERENPSTCCMIFRGYNSCFAFDSLYLGTFPSACIINILER